MPATLDRPSHRGAGVVVAVLGGEGLVWRSGQGTVADLLARRGGLAVFVVVEDLEVLLDDPGGQPGEQ